MHDYTNFEQTHQIKVQEWKAYWASQYVDALGGQSSTPSTLFQVLVVVHHLMEEHSNMFPLF
jgi:hypothetical protein